MEESKRETEAGWELREKNDRKERVEGKQESRERERGRRWRKRKEMEKEEGDGEREDMGH